MGSPTFTTAESRIGLRRFRLREKAMAYPRESTESGETALSVATVASS